MLTSARRGLEKGEKGFVGAAQKIKKRSHPLYSQDLARVVPEAAKKKLTLCIYIHTHAKRVHIIRSKSEATKRLLFCTTNSTWHVAPPPTDARRSFPLPRLESPLTSRGPREQKTRSYERGHRKLPCGCCPNRLFSRTPATCWLGW